MKDKNDGRIHIEPVEKSNKKFLHLYFDTLTGMYGCIDVTVSVQF